MRLHTIPVLILAASLFAGACRNDSAGDARTETPADTMAMSPTRDMMDRKAYSDARFLQEMTVHHRMALHMVAMAQTMATSGELKAMAAKMGTDQQAEITQMAGFLRAMGETPDTTSMMGMMGMNAAGANAASREEMMGMMGMPMTMEEMGAMQPFDRAFLVSMIGHHSTGITMSAEAQAKSTNADVLRLARGIVTIQADEIVRMQRMLDAMGPAADSTMRR